MNEIARCTDDYHYARCDIDGYKTTGCCTDDEIDRGTCSKLCIMHETGAVCEDAPKPNKPAVINKPEAECGNNIVEVGEQCDGTLLNGHSCADKYGKNAKGDISCDPTTCSVIYDNCEAGIPRCGNSIVEQGEQCDGAKLNGHSCADKYGVNAQGDIGCDPTTCRVIYDNCDPDIDNCGNGVLDDGEDCDGVLMREKNCDSMIEGATGTLKCTNRCKYDPGECRVSLCGNGVIDPGESCDTTVPEKLTCNDVVHATRGTLSCNAQCQLDISECRKPNVGDFCDDPDFSVCDDGNSIQCSGGVITKTVCGAFYSNTCVELETGDDNYILAGCINNYLECDNVGDVAYQCYPNSDYISVEMTCMKDKTSDKNYWYYLADPKWEVCPYSCDIHTGKCARLVPEQDTRCDLNTFEDYCQGNVSVNCEMNITMSSVHAESCENGCAVFSSGNATASRCIYPNSLCSPGDPDKTICISSYLVTMSCISASDGSLSEYLFSEYKECPHGCDPDTNKCVTLHESEGNECNSSNRPECVDDNLLLYCDASRKYATYVCQIGGEGLCIEANDGANCREICTTPGETRSICVDGGDNNFYTKHEICSEINGHLVFETQNTEACANSCNFDRTGCYIISPNEGKPCRQSKCDGDTWLYCNNGKYEAYYCPLYEEVCAVDSYYGSYCFSKCFKTDENYSACYYDDSYSSYVEYTYTCTQDPNGVLYAQETDSRYCTMGCNEDGTACDTCTIDDTSTMCTVANENGDEFTFYLDCVANASGEPEWQYRMRDGDYVYNYCPNGCNSAQTACK